MQKEIIIILSIFQAHNTSLRIQRFISNLEILHSIDLP